jgi:hypothetical protein
LCCVQGVLYCTGCLPKGVPLDWPKVFPIFAGAEVDSYPMCEACGTEHDYMVLHQYAQMASLGEEG